MEITQIRIFPVEEGKLKAFVSVIFDHCFVVSDMKIIEGERGLFVSMPSKKRRNGTFRDIAHPLNHETRRTFEEAIIGRYREVIAGEAEPASALRSAQAPDQESLDQDLDELGPGEDDDRE